MRASCNRSAAAGRAVQVRAAIATATALVEESSAVHVVKTKLKRRFATGAHRDWGTPYEDVDRLLGAPARGVTPGALKATGRSCRWCSHQIAVGDCVYVLHVGVRYHGTVHVDNRWWHPQFHPAHANRFR